jgi:hypothetical protein
MFLLMVLICSSNGIEENLVGTYLSGNSAVAAETSQATEQGIYIGSTVFKTQDNSDSVSADYENFPTVTTFLDYMPFMVFTNMFAIFYLEVICMTKKTAKKQDEDKLLGHYINGGITFFYALIFVSMLVLSAFNYNMNTPTPPAVGNFGGIG